MVRDVYGIVKVAREDLLVIRKRGEAVQFFKFTAFVRAGRSVNDRRTRSLLQDTAEI